MCRTISSTDARLCKYQRVVWIGGQWWTGLHDTLIYKAIYKTMAAVDTGR